ncbi:MAG: hypothetical protein ACR2QT_10815 [Woeseiaceae bacterium]
MNLLAQRPNRFRGLFLSMLAVVLSACGGGGSGGGGSNNPQTPSTPPKSISGVVMLGPVSSADIEISGTGGVLVSGTTAADGSFGPLSYNGSYSGPLRIRAIGTAGSTWICDFRIGCPIDGAIIPWGSSVNFDGTLEAVRSAATSGDFVSVSFLSNLAAKRVDVLGTLTAANADAAHADIAAMIRAILGEQLTDLGLTLPDDFASLELFDLQNLPAPGGPDDPVSLLLSFLNSSGMGLSNPNQTTGQFLDLISGQIAAQPVLPISGQDFLDPSQESFVAAMLIQLLETQNANDPPISMFDALLSPFNINDVLDSTFDTYFAIPALNPVSDVYEFINDAALQSLIVRDIPITTSTGAQLNLGDIGTDVLAFGPTPPTTPWFTATPVLVAGQPNVRIELNNAAIATLANDTYTLTVEVFSTTGEYRRGYFDVTIDVALVGRQIFAGNDITADERSTVVLNGSTTSPNEVDTISWAQLAGPTVDITAGDTLQPSVQLPSVDTDAVALLQLDVSFTTGEMRTDTMNINIRAFLNIADVIFADANLQQCVDDAAMAGGFTEVIELTDLVCTGVSDTTGIDVFSNLTTLDLSGNTLTTLQSVLALNNLQFVDLRGNPTLPCAEIDQLAQRLTEGTDLLVDDSCRGAFTLDLSGNGFDAALDEVRNQIYVSVPTRNEIVVISTADLRIVDRLLMPGTPYGIDLSIDGTRVFAALNGSNAIAVVDIDQLSVSTIDLGVSTNHPTTYDVVEGEPDRLFVSANPSSGGLAYVAQVRLDQGNISSPVANQTFIRSRPHLARSPDLQFVYVGSGFSPNSLYKLSLLDPDAAIVLEDDHGSVGGTDNLALNQTGTRIALGGGQVLRTGSFIEEGRVSGGKSVGSTLTDTLFVAGPSGVIESFDFTSLAQTGTIETTCNNGTSSRILAYNGDNSFMLLQQNTACLFATVSRSMPPDPFAALRFPDLALERCVIDTAIAMGYTEPAEFTTLDCSATPRTILSLEGIHRLVNLETLDISNSGVINLSPLANMTALQSLVAQNANISVVSPLLSITTLASVDLTGNASVLCADLDQLVASGITVQSDACTDTVRIELGGIGHDLEYDAAGNRIFVSIPSLNRISEIDLGVGSITQNFTLSGQPHGIDLSSDLQTVYAALRGLGDLAVLDTTTGNSEDIDISFELDDDRTWDVAEVSTDRVVVSTNPGSNGLGYIVEVRRDLANAATRVASQTIIRASPIFAVSPNQSAVYVGSGFSPNSLYKLDATQAELPVVLEDDHGQVSGTSSLALSPDGSRIYLLSGQVLSTDTFTQVAQFQPGRSTVSTDGTELLIGDTASDSARVYSTTTTGEVGNRQWGCDLLNLSTIEEFGDGVLVLGDDLVCYSQIVPYP